MVRMHVSLLWCAAGNHVVLCCEVHSACGALQPHCAGGHVHAYVRTHGLPLRTSSSTTPSMPLGLHALCCSPRTARCLSLHWAAAAVLLLPLTVPLEERAGRGGC